MTKLLKTNEVLKQLNISFSTLTRLRKEGKLTTIKLGHKTLRFIESEVDKLEEKSKLYCPECNALIIDTFRKAFSCQNISCRLSRGWYNINIIQKEVNKMKLSTIYRKAASVYETMELLLPSNTGMCTLIEEIVGYPECNFAIYILKELVFGEGSDASSNYYWICRKDSKIPNFKDYIIVNCAYEQLTMRHMILDFAADYYESIGE